MDFHFPHNNIISKNTYRRGDKVRKVETITAIPSREAWIYEKPELIKQIRQGVTRGKGRGNRNFREFREDIR